MKVVVLAHPRSGSNSLVEVLQRHPAIGVIENEPFAEGYPSWDPAHQDFRARLIAGEEFHDLVDEVFSVAGGLKELTYQLGDDELRALALRDDVRVVTLERRNRLETAVSQVVAEQTDLWKTWDAHVPLEDVYRDLPPLDLDLVRSRMEWTEGEVARLRAATEGVEALDLVYEELYRGSVTEQNATLDRLWSFLDLEAVDSPQLRHFLSTAVQQSRPSTYGQAPNLRDVEAALGSDARGHLPAALLTERA